jgi:hypothetical protein
MPEHEAKSLAENLLQRFSMESIAERRNPALTMEERFCAMLLRAAMVKDAIIVVERPFSILTNLRDEHFVMDALEKVDDIIAETHIFDYSWDKVRYGVLGDAEA